MDFLRRDLSPSKWRGWLTNEYHNLANKATYYGGLGQFDKAAFFAHQAAEGRLILSMVGYGGFDRGHKTAYKICQSNSKKWVKRATKVPRRKFKTSKVRR